MAEKRRPQSEMCADSRILMNVMKTHFIDGKQDFVSYGELAAAIGGRNVQGAARALLRTARKHIEQDYNILTEAIAGKGIARTGAYAGVLVGATRHIGRTSRKALRRVGRAIADKELSNDERIAVGAHMSALGAIGLFVKPSNVKKLEGKLAELKVSELPTAETLRLFEK